MKFAPNRKIQFQPALLTTHLCKQPRFCVRPPARSRRAGDVQRLSGFYVCQSGEISQPDQFCLFRVFFLKLDQRVLKGKEVVIGLVRAGDDVDVGDCNFLPIATVF